MVTKPGRIVAYHEGLRPIKSHEPFIIWSYEITWKTKIIITPLPEWLSYQTWRGVSSLWWPLPIKSKDPFITSPCKITWQTKTIMSPLLQCLWPPNLVGSWFTLGGLLIIKSFKALMMQSCKVMCQTKIGSMVTYLHVFLPIKLH